MTSCGDENLWVIIALLIGLAQFDIACAADQLRNYHLTGRGMIVAVNGQTDQAAINYMVDNMPSSDARHLRMVYKLATPNIDLTQNFECEECGYDQEMEVPLTADFFWPDR